MHICVGDEMQTLSLEVDMYVTHYSFSNLRTKFNEVLKTEKRRLAKS